MNPPVTFDTVKFLKEELTKPTEDSKKWKAFVRGIYGVAAMFAFTTIAFIVKPDRIGELVNVANIAIGAYASIVSIYLGAQGAVEFKNTAALTKVATEGSAPTPTSCPPPAPKPKIDNPDK